MASERLVIVNTTPLINFAEIGRVELLRELFGRVTVPTSVVAELRAKHDLFPSAAAAVSSPFLNVRDAAQRLSVASLAWELHEGEADCIALALESPSSLLVLDELAARNVAESHSLKFTGTVGCLMMAKDMGLIPAIAPLLDDLRAKSRFWLTRKLVERVLRDAGELPAS